jgi:hypothetical protein
MVPYSAPNQAAGTWTKLQMTCKFAHVLAGAAESAVFLTEK